MQVHSRSLYVYSTLYNYDPSKEVIHVGGYKYLVNVYINTYVLIISIIKCHVLHLVVCMVASAHVAMCIGSN